MKEENVLSRDISLAGGKAQADAACKKLLANKIILAWIMKHSMEEYRVFEEEYIAEHFIEGDPVIGEAAVHQDDILSVWNGVYKLALSENQEGLLDMDMHESAAI